MWIRYKDTLINTRFISRVFLSNKNDTEITLVMHDGYKKFLSYDSEAARAEAWIDLMQRLISRR
jgi:hypothetical protein